MTEDLIPVFLTALAGAAVPALIAVFAAFKARAAADGVTDWKDYVVDFVDNIKDELDGDEDEDLAK